MNKQINTEKEKERRKWKSEKRSRKTEVLVMLPMLTGIMITPTAKILLPVTLLTFVSIINP